MKANPMDDVDVGGDGIPLKPGEHVTEVDGELVTIHADGSMTKFVEV